MNKIFLITNLFIPGEFNVITLINCFVSRFQTLTFPASHPVTHLSSDRATALTGAWWRNVCKHFPVSIFHTEKQMLVYLLDLSTTSFLCQCYLLGFQLERELQK